MSKPTRVEKETLLALLELGRRTGHSAYEVTMKRLQRRHGWPTTSCPHRLGNNERAQYERATEKWLYAFHHRGLAEIIHDRVKAGRSLVFFVGPFYKLTKEGQKLAKEWGRG